jgi:hypothetical protein
LTGQALDADTLRELHRLARSIPHSGRGAQAKASAIRGDVEADRPEAQPARVAPADPYLPFRCR